MLATQWFLVCLFFYLRQCAVQCVANLHVWIQLSSLSLVEWFCFWNFFSRPPAASSSSHPAYKHTIKSSSQTASPDSLGGWPLPPIPTNCLPCSCPFAGGRTPLGAGLHALLRLAVSLLAFTPSIRLPTSTWDPPSPEPHRLPLHFIPFPCRRPLPWLHFPSWILSSLDVFFFFVYTYLFTCSSSFPHWNICFKREGGIHSGFLPYS